MHPERVAPRPRGQPASGRRSGPHVLQRALMLLSGELRQGVGKWCDRLQEIAVPTLMIHGTADYVLPYTYSLALQAESQRAVMQPTKGTDCLGF